MKVAVLGLGAMGAAIARRLEEADAELVLYNRSPARLAEFVARGVPTAPTPARAAAGADAAITMLADGAAVSAVLLDGAHAVLGDHAEQRPATLIDMSTIDVETSARVATRARELGVGYLRAPVSGNPGVVAAGRLAILASGDPETLAKNRPLLEKIGPKIFDLGTGEQARVMKLALNLMLAGTAELLAEALTLGEANDLDRARMLEVIAGSVMGSPFVAYKAGPLAAEDYTSTFAARLMRKDLGHALECARSAAVPLPLTAVVQELLTGCIGSGMEELDFTVLVPRLQREAGLRAELPVAGAPAGD